MKTILKLGSILLDGTPVKPGIRYQPGQTIRFADGNDLQWVVVNGLLIADRALLVNISWDDLHDQGLVSEPQLTLDHQKFLCRFLKVGRQEEEPNEWDAALDATSDDDELWHWKQAAFWGQEILPASLRAIRGLKSARYWYYFAPESQSDSVGYRPVLELLPSEQLVYGARICAIGGQSVLRGKLLDATAYDAIIQPDPTSMMAEADEGKCYVKLSNGTVLFDRTQMTIQAIKEE